MAKKIFIFGIGLVVLVGILFFALGSDRVSSFETVSNYDGEMTIYKSGSCGCCNVYSNYFEDRGNPNVDVINSENLNLLKEEYGVPSELESCHTTIIGDYFVEGHIPLEAVEKLLSERPDIAGIAMPGMPGGKNGDFVIYAVNHDGTYEEFMRI